MNTKKIILGAIVILVLAALLSTYLAKNWEGISVKNTEATVTLPNGTVKQISGISGFPASGGSSRDRPPTLPE